MKRLETSTMASIEGGRSKNCGNGIETAVVMKTCGLAGGLIGFALGGPVGAGAGSFFGGLWCHVVCYA